MNKTRRTLIISSFIMALALVVVIVSVSAAWFGDMRMASHGGFVIESDALQDTASIDISSSKGMEGENIYPAVADLGYILKNGIDAPTGRVLKQIPLPKGIAEAAQVATVYFPIEVIGTPDKNFEAENRKSLHLAMLSANIGMMQVSEGGVTSLYRRVETVQEEEGTDYDNYAGKWTALNKPALSFDGTGRVTVGVDSYTYTVNEDTEEVTFEAAGRTFTAALIDFKDEFNVDVCLVEANVTADGKFESEKSVISTAADYPTAGLTGANVFYECYGYDTYMLVQPGKTYFIKAEIYFNHVDEECNIDLLNTVVRFNFKLNIFSDGSYIRTHAYRTEGV